MMIPKPNARNPITAIIYCILDNLRKKFLRTYKVAYCKENIILLIMFLKIFNVFKYFCLMTVCTKITKNFIFKSFVKETNNL